MNLRDFYLLLPGQRGGTNSLVLPCIIALAAIVMLYSLRRYWRSEWRLGGLHKKCVFITGCDSGFGHALSIRLDGLGVPVFAGCLTKKGAHQLQEKCSDKLNTVMVDVSSPESIREAYETVALRLPSGTVLWAVVNNAGVFGPGGPVEFVPRQEYTDMLTVNFLGVVEVTTVFLPLLKKSKGRVVNISSVAGFVSTGGFPAYAASKHAVSVFSDILRLEKAAWGISVSCLYPSGFRTQIHNAAENAKRRRARWSALPSDIKEQYGEDYPELSWKDYSEMVDRSDRTISLVLDAYEHAIFARKPQAHYYPGCGATILRILSCLPSCFLDAHLRSKYSAPLPKILR